MSNSQSNKKYVVKVMGLSKTEYEKLVKLAKEGESPSQVATRIVKNYLKKK